MPQKSRTSTKIKNSSRFRLISVARMLGFIGSEQAKTLVKGLSSLEGLENESQSDVFRDFLANKVISEEAVEAIRAFCVELAADADLFLPDAPQAAATESAKLAATTKSGQSSDSLQVAHHVEAKSANELDTRPTGTANLASASDLGASLETANIRQLDNGHPIGKESHLTQSGSERQQSAAPIVDRARRDFIGAESSPTDFFDRPDRDPHSTNKSTETDSFEICQTEEDTVVDELRADEVAELAGPRSATAADEPIGNIQPVSEQPVSEQPVSEQPVSEQPVSEQPVSEQPVSEQPVSEQPVSEQPVSEQPVSEQPIGEQPVSEQPIGEAASAKESESSEPSQSSEPSLLANTKLPREESVLQSLVENLEPKGDPRRKKRRRHRSTEDLAKLSWKESWDSRAIRWVRETPDRFARKFPKNAWKWAKRNPRLSVPLSAAGAFILLFGSTLFSWLLPPSSPSVNTASTRNQPPSLSQQVSTNEPNSVIPTGSEQAPTNNAAREESATQFPSLGTPARTENANQLADSNTTGRDLQPGLQSSRDSNSPENLQPGMTPGESGSRGPVNARLASGATAQPNTTAAGKTETSYEVGSSDPSQTPELTRLSDDPEEDEILNSLLHLVEHKQFDAALARVNGAIETNRHRKKDPKWLLLKASIQLEQRDYDAVFQSLISVENYSSCEWQMVFGGWLMYSKPVHRQAMFGYLPATEGTLKDNHSHLRAWIHIRNGNWQTSLKTLEDRQYQKCKFGDLFYRATGRYHANRKPDAEADAVSLQMQLSSTKAEKGPELLIEKFCHATYSEKTNKLVELCQKKNIP